MGLLMVVWAGLAIYGIELVRRVQRMPAGPAAAAGPIGGASPGVALDAANLDAEAYRPVRLAPIAGALIAAALWPWVSISQPLPGFLMSAAMMVAALTAVIRCQREPGAGRLHRPIAIFAGWATAVTYAAFATLLTVELGISSGLAVTIAMMLCAGAGMVVQAQLGSSTSFSIALIWALVGLALATMTIDPNIAIAAVLGITAMIVVLVRAAS